MIQGNGVFEREGRWFMDPSQVKGAVMPHADLGPFTSVSEADAAASYVFSHWITDGELPAIELIRQRIYTPEIE